MFNGKEKETGEDGRHKSCLLFVVIVFFCAIRFPFLLSRTVHIPRRIVVVVGPWRIVYLDFQNSITIPILHCSLPRAVPHFVANTTYLWCVLVVSRSVNVYAAFAMGSRYAGTTSLSS